MNNPFFDPNNQFNNLDRDLDDAQDNEVPSEQTTKTVRKFLLILISIGLVIGIFSSWIIVKLLNQYGLTEKTNQIEQIRK